VELCNRPIYAKHNREKAALGSVLTADEKESESERERRTCKFCWSCVLEFIVVFIKNIKIEKMMKFQE